MYAIFYNCTFKCDYRVYILPWMSNLVGVLVTCICHPDIHILLTIPYCMILVYIKPKK